MSIYHTIKEQSSALYKEKGSKFFAHAFPVRNEIEIRNCLDELRKQYHDARHHCYAWVLGLENQSFRANDDGEPSHSAGDPILGQIRSNELTNVLIVVVRYFGGTKLGVGGLIQAYKTAAEESLRETEKIQIFETIDLSLNFPYDLLSTIERLIAEFDIEVSERDFKEDCNIIGRLKKDFLNRFNERIVNLYTLNIQLEEP